MSDFNDIDCSVSPGVEPVAHTDLMETEVGVSITEPPIEDLLVDETPTKPLQIRDEDGFWVDAVPENIPDNSINSKINSILGKMFLAIFYFALFNIVAFASSFIPFMILFILAGTVTSFVRPHLIDSEYPFITTIKYFCVILPTIFLANVYVHYLLMFFGKTMSGVFEVGNPGLVFSLMDLLN